MTNSGKRSQPKVQFSLNQTVFIQPPRDDSENDNSSINNNTSLLYYTQEDYRTFREDIKLALQKDSSIMRDSDVSFCLRGLECRTPRGARRKTCNRIRAKNAVLQEQKRQQDMQDNGCFDFEMIAEIYKGYCLTSVSQAQRTGKYDAAVAERMYQQDEKKKIKMATLVVVDHLPSSSAAEKKNKCSNNKSDDGTASTASSADSYSTATAYPVSS